MFGMSVSEVWFYGGIALVILAVVLSLAGAAVFSYTGRRLRRKLEEEYGKPWK